MKLYRYQFKIMDENREEIEVREHSYRVVRETPKGYWFYDGGKKKWVSKTSKKRFAYPTKKQAMINFIRRTERYKAILMARFRVAELALIDGEIMYEKMKNE